ncbi:MAG: MBL fold metallo-hydrolase [Pseudomonadota bacterium]
MQETLIRHVPMPLRAPDSSGGAQVAGVYRRRIGDIVVTALSDGYIDLDPDMLTGSTHDENVALLGRSFLPEGTVDTSINGYVIETGGKTLLVDGGAAEAFGPTAGKMQASLAAAGVKPEAIDMVFCSHLHPDHVGLFTDNGQAAFANAEFVTHKAEHGFWTNDDNFASADDDVKGFAAVAQGAVTPYANQLRLIEDGADLVQGVTARHMPGHTPGHTGLMLSSNGAELLIWIDIVHVGPVQFARPEITIPFDVDQPAAAATRAKVLDEVVSDRLEIAGSHLVFPSFGHIERDGSGYRFIPSRWQHVV